MDGIYSRGKKQLEEEGSDVVTDKSLRNPDVSVSALAKAAAELKANLPELKERIADIEKLEERYLLRKADLKGVDVSIAGFSAELNGLAAAVKRIAESVGNVEEYNRKRMVVLGKLEKVLDGYGSFVQMIRDVES